VKPKQYFDAVWSRCARITALHAYLEANLTEIMKPDELLRAEWVARVGALDLYIHELVSQGMLEVFGGTRNPTQAFQKFRISSETLARIRTAASSTDAGAAFDLEIRAQLGRQSFQFPEDIADAVRLFSDVELWNGVALAQGATPATKSSFAKSLKKDLSAIVERRNKIAHEGDLQPGSPRVEWPISKQDLVLVTGFIGQLVTCIESIV
jgi:hypothetical protein